MPLVKKDNPIALEIDKFDKKVKQFQDYLENNNPHGIEDDKKRHAEFDCQIKIMNNLPTWLAALKSLKITTDESKDVALRGDGEMSGLMKAKTQ